MRVQPYSGYGFTIPTSMLVPAPKPPTFRGLGGEWEDWCDVHYWTPENNTKCKHCPIKDPFLGKCLSFAPYTMAGRAARGLPQQTDLERLGPSGTVPGPETPVPAPAPSESWFERNKVLVIVGGALGLGALLLVARKGRGGGLFGMGRVSRRRKSRRSR